MRPTGSGSTITKLRSQNMQNIQFSFLNQAAPVEELLRQCKAR